MPLRHLVLIQGSMGKAKITLLWGHFHSLAEVDTVWENIDKDFYEAKDWHVVRQEKTIREIIGRITTFAVPQRTNDKAEVNAILEAAEMTHRLSR